MKSTLGVRAREIARSAEADLFGWELPPLDIALREQAIQWDLPGAWCLRCGETVGDGEQSERGCASCRGRPTPIERVIRLGEYQAPLSNRILQVKQQRWHAMAAEFGRRLGDQVVAAMPPGERPTLVAAIPMPRLRRWWRGIDHSEEIGVVAAARLGIPFSRPLLQRSGPTQVSRSRSDRERSTGRFVPRRSAPRILSGAERLLLVDDVRTTGSTLRQAARAIQSVTPELRVIAGVVAVVSSPRRINWGSARDKSGKAGSAEQEST